MPAPDPAEEWADEGLASVIAREAEEIERAAEARGVTVRLIGSLAIHHHCPEHGYLLRALGRRPYRDIDIVTRSREEGELRALFAVRGYEPDLAVEQSREFGINRLIFHRSAPELKVCVFPDKIQMAHTIELASRLDRDRPTVTVADLLLSKLQIVDITENDVKDLAVLLAEHPLGRSDADEIDAEYVCGVIGRSWGFSHTALENLDRVAVAAAGYAALPSEVSRRVRERAAALQERILETPKSLRWRLRGAVGTRMRWFTEVEDVSRG